MGRKFGGQLEVQLRVVFFVRVPCFGLVLKAFKGEINTFRIVLLRDTPI